MLSAGVFSPCPFQQQWVGDRLSPVASLTKVRELRFALFNFCFLYSGRMMLYAFSFMEQNLGVVQLHTDIPQYPPLPLPLLNSVLSFRLLSYPSFFFFSSLSSTLTASLLMFSVSCTLIASEAGCICTRQIRVYYLCHVHGICRVSLKKNPYLETCVFILVQFQEWLHQLIHAHVICEFNLNTNIVNSWFSCK